MMIAIALLIQLFKSLGWLLIMLLVLVIGCAFMPLAILYNIGKFLWLNRWGYSRHN